MFKISVDDFPYYTCICIYFRTGGMFIDEFLFKYKTGDRKDKSVLPLYLQ